MTFKTIKMTLGLLITVNFFFSCAQFIKTADRDGLPAGAEGTVKTNEAVTRTTELSTSEFEKYAYELGLNPKMALTETEMALVKNRAQLRKMERAIQTEKEQQNYAKILPNLQTDKEKIEYLSLPTIEGRLAWANRNKIWNRAKPDPKMLDVSDKQDIAVGMTVQLVRRAWGEPEAIETSGNPIYRNERWKYVKDVPTTSGYKRERRFVFFESGRVVGWETE